MLPILLYTTFDNLENARRVTDSLLTKHYAACVNLIEGMESAYMWQGELTRQKEVIAILKTTPDQEPALMEELARLHPYETPCILSISTQNAHMPYVSWLFSQGA